MSDFLEFLYAGYIQPYVQSCPMDDGEVFRRSLWENGNTREERRDAEALFRFYAVHAFLLGLRTGEGLVSSGASGMPRPTGGAGDS